MLSKDNILRILYRYGGRGRGEGGGGYSNPAPPLTQVLVVQIEVGLSMRHFRTTFIPPPSPNGGGMKRKTAFKSNKCGKPLGQNYSEFVYLLFLY